MQKNLQERDIPLCEKNPVGIWKVNGYVRIVRTEVVAVADNANAAKGHQTLVGWRDGDIAQLNVLAAIANADLSCRIQIGGCSSLNLMFRVVPWASIVALSFALISGRWSEMRYCLFLFILVGFPGSWTCNLIHDRWVDTVIPLHHHQGCSAWNLVTNCIYKSMLPSYIFDRFKSLGNC